MSETLRPVAWQYTTESGNEHYTAIKAKALQFDANPIPLYTAPPSTAEAQARALGEFEQELLELGAKCRQEDPGWSDALAMVAGMARTKAKRIREEG